MHLKTAMGQCVPDNMIDLHDTFLIPWYTIMVHLPDTMIDLPDTRVDLPDTR